jgi:hypothetical protein
MDVSLYMSIKELREHEVETGWCCNMEEAMDKLIERYVKNAAAANLHDETPRPRPGWQHRGRADQQRPDYGCDYLAGNGCRS